MDPNNGLPNSSQSPSVMYNFLPVPMNFHQPIIYPAFQVRRPRHASSRIMELQKRHMEMFWKHQRAELDNLATSMYKQHPFPIARVKRVMKEVKDVKMISADAPIIFSKACELFILELTIRSWLHTEEGRRINMISDDISNAIFHSDQLQFLVGKVKGTEVQDDPIPSNQYWGIPQPFIAAHQIPSTSHFIYRPPQPPHM